MSSGGSNISGTSYVVLPAPSGASGPPADPPAVSGAGPSEPGSPSGGAGPASSGAGPAGSGAGTTWLQVQGGSDSGASAESDVPGLEKVRAMKCVTQRLHSVPEHWVIDTTDLPAPAALAAASAEVEACLAYCQEVGAGLEAADQLALGASACQEGGVVGHAPPHDAEFERLRAMLNGAEARLNMAKADMERIKVEKQKAEQLAIGGAPASGGGGGDWRAGYESAAPAWQDLVAPCVMPSIVFVNFESFISF